MLANRGTIVAKALRRSVPPAPIRLACRTIAILVARLPESIRDYVWQDLELRLERLVHTMIVAESGQPVRGSSTPSVLKGQPR